MNAELKCRLSATLEFWALHAGLTRDDQAERMTCGLATRLPDHASKMLRILVDAPPLLILLGSEEKPPPAEDKNLLHRCSDLCDFQKHLEQPFTVGPHQKTGHTT